jgi:predicted SAM-dependent methyltransferase
VSTTETSGQIVRVNVGSGGDALPGWINVDKSPGLLLARLPTLRRLLAAGGVLSDRQRLGFSTSVVYGNAAKHLAFADRSVDFVYSSHMIEHLSRVQGLTFLQEARRILKPGGTVRLATPDLAKLIAEYREGSARGGRDTAADGFMANAHFLHDTSEGAIRRFVSRNLSGHWHQWLYDDDSLCALLAEAGFRNPRVCEFAIGAVPGLDLVENRPESLFVEATAPPG